MGAGYGGNEHVIGANELTLAGKMGAYYTILFSAPIIKGQAGQWGKEVLESQQVFIDSLAMTGAKK